MLASSTACWTLGEQVGVVGQLEATVASAGLPFCCFQAGKDSGSRVMRAAMYGLLSPTTMHWLTSQFARMRSSSTAGATFLPPAVTRSSFLRPVIDR